jgi:hypothetical protein
MRRNPKPVKGPYAARVRSLDTNLPVDLSGFTNLSELTLQLGPDDELPFDIPASVRRLVIQGTPARDIMPLIEASPNLRELEVRSGWRIADAHVLASTFKQLAAHPSLESFTCWEFAVQEDMTGMRAIPKLPSRMRKFAYAVTSLNPRSGEFEWQPFCDKPSTFSLIPNGIPNRALYGSLLTFLRPLVQKKPEAIEFPFKMPTRQYADPFQDLAQLSDDFNQDVRYSPRIADLLFQHIGRTNTSIRDVTVHIYSVHQRLRLVLNAIARLKALKSVRIIIHCKVPGFPVRQMIRDALLKVRVIRDFDASWFDGKDFIPASDILQDHEDSLTGVKAVLALCAVVDLPRVGTVSPLSRLPRELIRVAASTLL